MMNRSDTIVAAATANGGALSLIRISGPEAINIAARVFRPAGKKNIPETKGFSIIYGDILDESGGFIDDVLVSVFRSPASYTGEDMAEISCHGSSYIVRNIIELLIRYGARAADPGEFTTRAFLAGKIDLSQAEAVADMISSHDRTTHSMAVTQMRGGYSTDLKHLRGDLLRIASLIELELDFSEEDVEFADRGEIVGLAKSINDKVSSLIDSFSLGNALKEGIGVAIVGSPNVGKSTLLNALLNDDRAMVSDIAGTTRDIIEERINLDGVEYRFIDTAGIRESADELERMGMERTFRSLEKAAVVLCMFDGSSGITASEIEKDVKALHVKEAQKLCIVLNKCDAGNVDNDAILSVAGYPVISTSAKYGINIQGITDYLGSLVDTDSVLRGDTVVSNARHYEALLRSRQSLEMLIAGIESGLSGDLVSQEIKEALYWLGTITGEITTDEILGEIFSKFCIGK